MTTREPRTLIIVGGGSAGWMTAIYLNKVFNADRQNFDITVIESPDIGVIGVGEATVHSIRFFFSAIGINESEMLRATNASLKTGILFRNWRKPVNGRVHEYFHPFEQQQSGESLDLSSAWLLANGENPARRYDQDVSISATLAELGRAPKARNSRAYQGVVPYGYHIDAVLGRVSCRFLRRLHGFSRFTDRVVTGRQLGELYGILAVQSRRGCAA